MGIKILGTGSFLPAKVVMNDDLAQRLDTSDEWIYSHTGIRSRHMAVDGETTSTMAIEAAKAALASASVSAADVGLVIVATSSADYNPFPSTACIVQGQLGCTNAGAYDLQAACAGFIYALDMARGFIRCNKSSKVLVIGSETMTRAVDWEDRSSCILFGDGAGAVVVGDDGIAGGDDSLSPTILGADGTGAHVITRSGGSCEPFTGEAPKMRLMGHEVFAFAVRTLAKTTDDLCARYGITPEKLDLVVAHQANRRIIEATARRMKLPMEKFYVNLETIANTSAASIPIALDQAVREGTLKDGMKIVMVGFGAGLTYAGCYCTWPNV